MKWHNCRQWFLNLQNFSPEQSCKTPLLLASIPVDISGKDQNQLMILASTTRVDKVISTQEGFVDQWSEKKAGIEDRSSTLGYLQNRGWGMTGPSFVMWLPKPALEEARFSDGRMRNVHSIVNSPIVPPGMLPPSWEQSSAELVCVWGEQWGREGTTSHNLERLENWVHWSQGMATHFKVHWVTLIWNHSWEPSIWESLKI